MCYFYNTFCFSLHGDEEVIVRKGWNILHDDSKRAFKRVDHESVVIILKDLTKRIRKSFLKGYRIADMFDFYQSNQELIDCLYQNHLSI